MTTTTFPPSTDEYVEQTDPRLQRRGFIRKAIAEATMLREKAAAFARQIEDLDTAIQEAADAHAEKCQPWQEELQRLEEEAIRRVTDREESDPTADARRGELRDLVEAANRELRQTKKRIESERLPLIAGRSDASRAAAKLPTELTLTNGEHGNPRLLTEQFCLQQRLKFLQARRKHAAERLRAAESLAAKAGKPIAGIRGAKWSEEGRGIGEARAERWRAEVAAASEDIAETEAALADVHQQLIAE